MLYFAVCLIIATLAAKLDYYKPHHQDPACALVPEGHYAAGQGFISVYRLGEDGDLL